jgi:hypothetical protein
MSSLPVDQKPNHAREKIMNGKQIAALLAVLCITFPPARAGDDGHERADVIVEWNQLLQANIPSTAPNPLVPRYYAILHIAMFDAANAIEREYSHYRSRPPAHPAASPEAAAAQAGHDVLVALIPAATATFDAALQTRLAGIQPWRAAAGVPVGRRAARDIIDWRANDGTNVPSPAWSLPPFPGLWQPTSSQGAQLANFGDFEPFALLTSTQYLPAPPPTLTSALYAADLEEVRALGSAASTVRTPEQTQTARLFASVGNSTTHFAAWNNVARDVAAGHHLSLVDTARLFALMNVAMFDGVQTSHTSKFIYGLWRPMTAIRRADEDLNSATIADPTWTPLLNTPAYPSHSSNQTCVGTSAARALARVSGKDEVAFSVTWIGTGGNANVTRNYVRFSELAEQQARSRVYGGIHFNFELTGSQESCTKVADYVVDNYLRPRRNW